MNIDETELMVHTLWDQLDYTWLNNHSFLDLNDYWKSGTWDLISVPGKIVRETKNGRASVQIVYTITLRRKTLFYTVNLILPCVMISLLSICVFYLPADAGEKMTLCISILFALVVFLLLISKILPPTSTSIPLISRYLLFTFIINIFAILVTVLIINWNYRTTRTHAMPKWVRCVFMEYLPRLLGMQRPIHVERELKIRSYLKNPHNTFEEAMSKTNTIETSKGTENRESMDGKASIKENTQTYSPYFYTGSPFHTKHAKQSNSSIHIHGTLHNSNASTPELITYTENSGDYSQTSRDEDFLDNKSSSDKSDCIICNRNSGDINFSDISSHNCSSLEQTVPNTDPFKPNIITNTHTKQYFQIKKSHDNTTLRKRKYSVSNHSSSEFEANSSSVDSDSLSIDEFREKLQSCKRKDMVSGNSMESSNNSSLIQQTCDKREDSLSYWAPSIKKATMAINYISAKLHSEGEFEMVLGDWKYVASVIDRLMLVIFAIVTTIGTVSLLTKAPTIFDTANQEDVMLENQPTG